VNDLRAVRGRVAAPHAVADDIGRDGERHDDRGSQAELDDQPRLDPAGSGSVRLGEQ